MANISIRTSADPAAGAEVAPLVVPAGVLWIVLTASVELVQGLTQTPWPSLVLDDGTNILFRALCGSAAQLSATTRQHSWSPGAELAGGASDAAATGPLARIPLSPGYRVRTITSGIGANSDYGALRLQVVELSSNDRLGDWL